MCLFVAKHADRITPHLVVKPAFRRFTAFIITSTGRVTSQGRNCGFPCAAFCRLDGRTKPIWCRFLFFHFRSARLLDSCLIHRSILLFLPFAQVSTIVYSFNYRRSLQQLTAEAIFITRPFSEALTPHKGTFIHIQKPRLQAKVTFGPTPPTSTFAGARTFIPLYLQWWTNLLHAIVLQVL